MVNLLKDQIIGYDVASLDATTLLVLKEPGRKRTTKSYVYCFKGGKPGRESTVYEYNALQHKLFVRDWFTEFIGWVHSDCDPWFELLFSEDEIIQAACWAHLRRKFEAIAKKSLRDGLANQAMRYIKALFRIEKEADNQGVDLKTRLKIRKEKSEPLLKQFKQWLDEYYPTVSAKSPLGKAMGYAIKHWQELLTFLEDARIRLDNNHTERDIKPFVMARKMFLFCDTIEGAKALSIHFSLMITAKQHQLDPFKYYCHILEQVPLCETLADYEALLPWNVGIERVRQAA